jgi:hypothetical protein
LAQRFICLSSQKCFLDLKNEYWTIQNPLSIQRFPALHDSEVNLKKKTFSQVPKISKFNSTLPKLLPPGADLKKTWKRILHPAAQRNKFDSKGCFIISYYILSCAGTRLNLFIVHFGQKFYRFPRA